MRIVGDDDVDKEYMIEMRETFYLEFYINLAKKADSPDHFRETMHTIPKHIPISRMPPTMRVSRFHMLRAHSEVNTYQNLEQRLEEDHGFEPAHTYLLQDMKCSCEKLNRTGLLCTGCSCAKAGLPYTLLCKCDGNCGNRGVVS